MGLDEDEKSKELTFFISGLKMGMNSFLRKKCLKPDTTFAMFQSLILRHLTFLRSE